MQQDGDLPGEAEAANRQLTIKLYKTKFAVANWIRDASTAWYPAGLCGLSLCQYPVSQRLLSMPSSSSLMLIGVFQGFVTCNGAMRY